MEKLISAKSVQNPNDPDAEKVTGNRVDKLITDGACQSQDKRTYAEENNIEYTQATRWDFINTTF